MTDRKATGLNPGKAGPKGALEEPTATSKRDGRDEDSNVQRSYVKLTERERKRTRLEGTN